MTIRNGILLFIFFCYSLSAFSLEKLTFKKTGQSVVIESSSDGSKVVSYGNLFNHFAHAYWLHTWYYKNEIEDKKLSAAKNKILTGVDQVVAIRFKRQMNQIQQFFDFVCGARSKKEDCNSSDIKRLKSIKSTLKLASDEAKSVQAANELMEKKIRELFDSEEKLYVRNSNNIAFQLLKSYFRKPEKLNFVKINYEAPFEMQSTEITQEQWFQILGYNPSFFSERIYCKETFRKLNSIKMCPQLPVENIAYEQLEDLVTKLTALDEKYIYRIPSEGEWKFAAGKSEKSALKEDTAWFYENSSLQTHTVGLKKPDPVGLFDLIGNVFEMTKSDDNGKLKKLTAFGGAWLTLKYAIGPNFQWKINSNYTCFDVGARLVRNSK